MHVHELAGCTPTPLGHYLKALGVLRLVAEQADPDARGWWRGEHFWLVTTLEARELETFFLERYAPSPIVAPWNLGCGLYYEDDPGVGPIESSRASRFALLHEAISLARDLSCAFAEAIAEAKASESRANEKGLSPSIRQEAKARTDALKKEQARLKERLLTDARRQWRGGSLDWLDAALTLSGEGDPQYPALFGTGGNDGRLDFTNNFYQHLQRLIDTSTGVSTGAARPMLAGALYGRPGKGLIRGAVGQFLPGLAGGANMSAGYQGPALVNSWDFVLMLEGAIALCSGAARRADAAGAPQAAAPFAVRSRSAGYTSATPDDESARGEQWFPLWSEPARAHEVRALFREGRARVGRNGVFQPIGFAKSVARLGVHRGIEAFERFGYLERNGQSNLATPLGRWRVRAEPHQELLDEIDGWLTAVRGAARGDNAPAGITAAARRCDDAVFDVCRGGGVPARWQRLLMAMSEVERVLVASSRFTAAARLRPIPRLSTSWIAAADDGSPELRLAVALASQHATLVPRWQLPVRLHWSPVSNGTLRPPRFELQGELLAAGSDLVGAGRDLERDCIAVVVRRVMLAARAPEGVALPDATLPLRAPNSCSASLADLMGFLDASTDDRKILFLARAFMAIGWREGAEEITFPRARVDRIDADFAVMRLAHAPDGVRRDHERVPIALDPEIARRLVAGDLSGAGGVALRRLRASGLRPVLRALAGDRTRSRRIVASLAFPLSTSAIALCADRVTKPYQAPEAAEPTASLTEAT